MDEHVTFEQAKALKKLGFPQDSTYNIYNTYYVETYGKVYNHDTEQWEDDHGVKFFHSDICFKPVPEDYYVAPTWSEFRDWLRKEKNILFCVKLEHPMNSDTRKYAAWFEDISQTEGRPTNTASRYGNTYEEVIIYGITDVIEFINKQSKNE